jgi:hypothetical protein
MHNCPDRGGTGHRRYRLSERRLAASASVSWAHAVRNSARTLPITGQTTEWRN